MGSKFRKSFVSTGALTGEPVTILVDYVEGKGYKGITLESLEGSFSSPEAFEIAYKQYSATVDAKKESYNFLSMSLRTTQTLTDILGEAMAASEGN